MYTFTYSHKERLPACPFKTKHSLSIPVTEITASTWRISPGTTILTSVVPGYFVFTVTRLPHGRHFHIIQRQKLPMRSVADARLL